MNRRFEAWYLGGLVSLVSESFPWPWGLILACDCGECLNLRGLDGGQAYFVGLIKYIFIYSRIVIGNHHSHGMLIALPANKATPTKPNHETIISIAITRGT